MLEEGPISSGDRATTPMKTCDNDANDKPIESTCKPGIPLDTIVLPAGY